MTYRACTIQDESDFFHVQYEKRRVLLAAERKCLVTHHRVTCLLHFKRECTSFAHARVCVCVCYDMRTKKNVLGSVLSLFPRLVFLVEFSSYAGMYRVWSLCYFSLCLWGLRISISSLRMIRIYLCPYSNVSRCVLFGVVLAWVTISRILICVASKLGHSTLSMWSSLN